MQKTIFRSYDIRGIVDEELTEQGVELIGRAIATYAQLKGQQKIICARDGRLSGPRLMQALQKGLTATGCEVIDVGIVPTPLLYFATYQLNCPNGVMLTGSHNPGNYNGIKMMIDGVPLAGDEIEKLYHMIEALQFNRGQGQVQQHQTIIEEYITRIKQEVQLQKPLKVVVDCGNGVAGVIAEKLYRAVGCDVIPLFCEVDGNFPNHHPDPSQEKNLQDLRLSVAKHQADVGLAFDGDADRLGVITKTGQILWPDKQLILFAKDVLKREPGAEVIYDVKCSSVVSSMIEDFGGKATMCATGHSWVKAKMRETGAALGGEYSGHIFIKERWYGFDDGLYAGVRLLEIIANTPQDLDEFIADIPKTFATPEIKIPLNDDEKFIFIEKFKSKAHFDEGQLNTLDGVRVDYNDGFGLVRCSNTTPYLVCRFEAQSKASLQRIQDAFYLQLKACDATLQLPLLK